jgi:hypothetical protein
MERVALGPGHIRSCAPLERRSVMRRAEENKLVDTPQPFVARHAVMIGAAATAHHAVPDEHELGAAPASGTRVSSTLGTHAR